MKRTLFAALMVLGMLGLLIGCSDNGTQPDNQESIADQFGGYTPTDEQPAFGETALAADMQADVEFDDPMLTDPVVDDDINNAAAIYALRIVWGQMEYDSTVTTVTDWSGSSTADSSVEGPTERCSRNRDHDHAHNGWPGG